VDILIPFYNQTFGRSTKELHTILGVTILQQMFDLNDQETIDQLAFNIQWHYALNITEESDSAKYISQKTLWNIRDLIAENSLESIIFNKITDKLKEICK